MATTSNLQYSSGTHKIYDVTFFDSHITTTVTHIGSIVNDWIEEIENIYRSRLHNLIVGFDMEWLPDLINNKNNNPVAILQLCVDSRCLIFQLIYADKIPESLVDFLLEEDYTFVGVGIQDDIDKLQRDYGLEVYNVVDLRYRAASEFSKRELINAGLKRLAKEVLGKEIEKNKSVTMSKWDEDCLSDVQVQYACVDAYISFEIGRVLMSNS